MPQTTIDHLPTVSSNHTPLMMKIMSRQDDPTKYFKFLHYWIENASFLDTLRGCWNREVNGNPMGRLYQKIKRVFATFSA